MTLIDLLTPPSLFAGKFVAGREKRFKCRTRSRKFKLMWVFGYGSLIWKADFPFKKKLSGYIRGYRRRFYQHSVDHRGRPHKPGRVVTLLPSNETDVVWGVAYEIFQADVERVSAHLDYREKTGYKKQSVLFYPVRTLEDNSEQNSNVNIAGVDLDKLPDPFQLTIYIGTEDNEWYAGPADITDIAKQIFEAEGPSGTNKEYLYNLADAMRTMVPGVSDEHLFALEKEVRKIESKSPAPN